jgi:hypothetical protein
MYTLYLPWLGTKLTLSRISLIHHAAVGGSVDFPNIHGMPLADIPAVSQVVQGSPSCKTGS